MVLKANSANIRKTPRRRRRQDDRGKEEENTKPVDKRYRRDCFQGDDDDYLNSSHFQKLQEPADIPQKSPLPPPNSSEDSSTEIWDLMCKMDVTYKRTADPLSNHPDLDPHMRAMLLDWIMDVCEAFNLHRETLYLAIDYLDRYIAAEKNIIKQHLQLIGISCLFVASKVEEIYLPKLTTFAYVTDGACTEAEILDMEVLIMKTLTWKLMPVTPCNWLNIYLQFLSFASSSSAATPGVRSSPRRNILLHRDLKKQDHLLLIRPLYNGNEFVQTIRILDLCSLDMRSLAFTYSTLAAAAIYNTKGKNAALECSGLDEGALTPCAHWMAPYAKIIKRIDQANLDVLPPIPPIGVDEEARHLIQSQCISLAMLEKAQLLSSSSKYNKSSSSS